MWRARTYSSILPPFTWRIFTFHTCQMALLYIHHLHDAKYKDLTMLKRRIREAERNKWSGALHCKISLWCNNTRKETKNNKIFIGHQLECVYVVRERKSRLHCQFLNESKNDESIISSSSVRGSIQFYSLVCVKYTFSLLIDMCV